MAQLKHCIEGFVSQLNAKTHTHDRMIRCISKLDQISLGMNSMENARQSQKKETAIQQLEGVLMRNGFVLRVDPMALLVGIPRQV